jgi:hypothetical protein
MEKQVHPKDVEPDVVRVGPQPNFFEEKKSVLKVFFLNKKSQKTFYFSSGKYRDWYSKTLKSQHQCSYLLQKTFLQG